MSPSGGDDIGATIRRLLGQIAPEASLGTLGPNEDLRDALEIDSFDFLSFLVAINRELGVSIPEGDYAKVATFQGLVDYINHARRSVGP